MTKKIGDSNLQLIKGDLTALGVDAIVFYARPDLQLGSGFGTAISVRGGPEVVKELKALKTPVPTGNAVITKGGNLKARYIIHAVGPRFQEPDTEVKLRKTIRAVFDVAKENNIISLAFPPMGAGFYGVPLNLCAKVMVEEITSCLSTSEVKDVTICVLDNREYRAFEPFFHGGKNE